MRVAILHCSPRRDGNSWMLAGATLAGAIEAGHAVELLCLTDHVEGLIRDCRSCRRADGDCSIDDGLRELLTGRLLAADAWVYATPLYWYGISSILKAFIDRLFCYTAKSYPQSDAVIAALMHKRSAALISAEESEVGAYLPTLQHLQELSRYLHHDFVGAVVGVGNRRGEVEADANRPLDAAYQLGLRLFESRVTDYQLDTDRPSSVWSSWSGLRS